MTGFVDPEFKRIKVTEPNFFIWRISKAAEENYEAKQIRKEYFGNFYVEDSYIVYSSTPVKKVPGRLYKGHVSKMEIHVHIWLGSLISDDEEKRTVIKAMELDEVLEGAGTVHREKQGNESSRFLSYFKKGMFIRKGEIAKVLKQDHVDLDLKLYIVSQRGPTLVLTEELPGSMMYTSSTSTSTIMLETSSTFFVWAKPEAKDEGLVLQLEKFLKARNSNKKVIRIFDGTEEELAKIKLMDYEEYFILNSIRSLKEKKTDFFELQTKFRYSSKLYEVVPGDPSTITHVKNGPLEQSDLYNMDMCIVDHQMNRIWIWVCKKLSNEEKSRSINIAISYLENKAKLMAREEKVVTVSRVVAGSEPQEFKLLFKSWTDNGSFHPHHYFLNKPSKPVNMNFTADMLYNSPFLASETQLLDCGGGEVYVAMVDKKGLIKVDPENFGIFYSNREYLVRYKYTVNGNEKKILYHWVGDRVPGRGMKSIWRRIKQNNEFKDACVYISVKQYKETPHFFAIFQGKTIVLDSPSETEDRKMILDRYPRLVLRVIGGEVFNSVSIEVTPHHDALSSDGVYIVRTPTMSFVWCGASSKGDEREMGKKVANKWTRGYDVILEGYPTNNFRKVMGSFIIKKSSEVKETIPAQVRVPATLYRCSLSKEKFGVSEIFNFDQSDLSSRGIFILDGWDVIFVWVGMDVEEEILSYMEIALTYLDCDPSNRSHNLPLICVPQNHEPPIFTGFFPTWSAGEQETPEKVPRAEPRSGSQPEDVPRGKAVSDSQSEEGPQAETLSPSQPDDENDKLTDYQFWKKFNMKRAVFNQYPECKQNYLKIRAGK